MNARRFVSNKYDAVIIGGSIGGLIAASYLARSDARILLAEQGDRFGGRAEIVELGQRFRAPSFLLMQVEDQPYFVRRDFH